jgi:hypothetical protein
MKFRIGTPTSEPLYDIDEGMSKVSLHLLFEMKAKHGISAKDLQGMANYLNKYNGKPPEELMEDKVALRALMVVIWLTRRHYGERLTLEEANSFAMNEFFIELEEEPEGQPDPKAPADSAAAESSAEPST